ncbi:MAG: DUF177 domain-containing protein [Proteobacteria bacterium]|nr:DUF177 domain-containing protein [Pseudomonadota bacterium]
MSPPWSRPLEVDRLADGGADIDFAVPLAELFGSQAPQAGVAGSVQGRVHFTRQGGVAVADLSLSGHAELTCQRCLQPLQLPLDSQGRVALVETSGAAERVPPELETVLAPGGRTSIGDLIREEVLLALPIVPLHERSDCAAQPAAADEDRHETHQPFARLAELMKRQET